MLRYALFWRFSVAFTSSYSKKECPFPKREDIELSVVEGLCLKEPTVAPSNLKTQFVAPVVILRSEVFAKIKRT